MKYLRDNIDVDTTHTAFIVSKCGFFYNFTDFFGVYAGLGLGFQGLTPAFNISRNTINAPVSESRSDGFGSYFALPFNIGMQFNIGHHNTITFGAKIPILSQNYRSDRVGESHLRTYMLQLGYAFNF
ncbi:hypothetical protein CQA53_09090 [Helicobacter didelphidarum]|uniref:Outer membrane beta-barrel protein n=1 Tax=Helicobacter didelphidarum TaxID=2040648 RepID=A0A3D8IDT0_9HELI|nr:outer membrane beta-barrel protein [Helicobacter didelphidarum]RDU62691.1 hypothetical protein CQA53_09090 [Helicobacter didelphidarum]